MLIKRVSDATEGADKSERTILHRNLQLLNVRRSERDMAELQFREQEAYCVKLMETIGLRSTKYTSYVDTKETYQATLVQSSDVRFNEVTLKKALGAKMWDKVVKKTLDKVKLEQLVNAGEVDSTVVAAHATVVPKKPYIRISVKDEHEDA